MARFSQAMGEYRLQLERGYLQVAYQGLMKYFRILRSHFANRFPDFTVSSGIQYGYMDLTYFTLASGSLNERRLKITVAFAHDTFRTELWLSGSNRRVQAKYWSRIADSHGQEYNLASDPLGDFSMFSDIVVEDPSFADLDALTGLIEQGALAFSREIEAGLAKAAK